MERDHHLTTAAALGRPEGLASRSGPGDIAPALEQLCAHLCHELRTPLNAVIGFANVLLKNSSGHLDARELHFLERIRDNGAQLNGRLEGLLEAARREAVTLASGNLGATATALGLDYPTTHGADPGIASPQQPMAGAKMESAPRRDAAAQREARGMDDKLQVSSLDNIRKVGGEALLDQMIDLFIANAPKRLETLIEAQENADLDGVSRAAHSLRSSAANFGALRVQDLSGQIERLAGAGDAAPLPDLLEQLVAAFANARGQLEALRTHSDNG